MVLVEAAHETETYWPGVQDPQVVHTVALAALENFPLSQATHLVSAVELQAAAVYVPAEHTEQV